MALQLSWLFFLFYVHSALFFIPPSYPIGIFLLLIFTLNSASQKLLVVLHPFLLAKLRFMRIWPYYFSAIISLSNTSPCFHCQKPGYIVTNFLSKNTKNSVAPILHGLTSLLVNLFFHLMLSLSIFVKKN